MAKESGLTYLFSLFFAFLILAWVAIFHGMSWSSLAVNIGMMSHTQGENWQLHSLAIVETCWLVPIWAVVYGLQISWLIYAMVLGCRHFRTGCLIIDPPILPTSMFLTFALGSAGTLGWIVLWDNEAYYVYSAICMLAATVFLSLSVAISLHATKLYQDDIIARGYIVDVWTIRALVQNALTAFVAWTFVVTAYTIAMILKRFDLLEDDHAQYVSLSIMMAHIVIWMILDIWMARALTHFIVLPYIVYMIVFLQPMLSHAVDTPFFIMSSTYFAFTTFFIIMKSIVATLRCKKSAKVLKMQEEQFGAIEYKDDGEDLGNITLVHTRFPNPRSRVTSDSSSFTGSCSSMDDMMSTLSSHSNPNNHDFDNDATSQRAFALNQDVSNVRVVYKF